MFKYIHYTHMKPQNYYNRLFLFFILISFSLTLVYYKLGIVNDFYTFLLRFILILLLILSLSAFLEYRIKSDYMGPLEVYDVEREFKRFLDEGYEKKK
jgi:hypothetical protein